MKGTYRRQIKPESFLPHFAELKKNRQLTTIVIDLGLLAESLDKSDNRLPLIEGASRRVAKALTLTRYKLMKDEGENDSYKPKRKSKQ